MPKTTPPNHIGYILDGNRRWARQNSLPEFDGHLAGYSALRDVVKASFDQGVTYVSVYAFSNENWQRDKDEVSSLMKLAIRAASKDLGIFIKDKIRLRFLGRRDGLAGKLVSVIEKAEEATGMFTEKTLAICFNYGGQQEIVDAAKQCVIDGLSADEINETVITKRLYGADIPPIDMVVRTSGEQRLSNFMLWRVAYSELLFIDKYWPDMRPDDVKAILKEYAKRTRRYGA